MKMSLEEVETCVRILIQHARLRGVTHVHSVKYDLYWKVLSDDWVDFSKNPKVATGSIRDDIAGLRALLAEPSGASVVEMDRAASILSLLSQVLQDSSGYIVGPDSEGPQTK